MLLLTSTSDLLQVVTGSALVTDVHASFVDYDGTNVTPGRANTQISTAATTTVVASPGASVQRNVKALHVRNSDSSSNVITVKHTDGTTALTLFKCTLLPGAVLQFVDGVGFFTTPPQATATNNFSTTDQTINAATTALLTGSLLAVPPGKLQIGSLFRWTMSLSKTNAGTASNVFDIRVGTAGTSGDTSRVSFALPVGTNVVDTGAIEILCTCRGPLSASGIFQGVFSMVHNLSATGLATIPAVVINTTSAAFDVTVANLFVSLSCTTAASTVLTFQQVVAEAFNLS